MSSDITLEIVRYEPIESSYLLRSHILHPHEDITIICILRAEKANVLSVIEDHLLESISSTDWRYEEEEIDFSYVTEKYNHFLSNLAEEDRRSIHGLFSIQRGIRMMVSTFGDMRALIHESDGTLSDIQENTSAYHQFELISSGDILKGSTVILSSLDLHTHISEDFYRDIIEMDRESFEINTKETLSREKIDTCHIIRLSHLKRDRETQLLPLKKQSDIIRNSLQSLRASLEKNKKYQQFRRYI